MKLTLHVWRQKDAQTQGKMVDYTLDNVSEDMSFLEMMDVLNQQIIEAGDEPIAFDHDCREGICGMCSMVLMVSLTVLSKGRRRANCICAPLRMVTLFI